MQVLAIHKLPWSEDEFRADVEEYESELEDQRRSCWENAWLFVVSSEEPIDFGGFGMQTEPEQSPDDFQAAWLEEMLGVAEAAFYLHGYSPQAVLYYKGQPLPLPSPTSPPEKLIRQIPYTAPD